MKPEPQPPCLIVNADDYGYFRCVSRGILAAGSQGIVTATGVFANAPDLAEQAAWLRECEQLDTGVHLNLTDGLPLTSDMRQKLSRWSGRFPRKFRLAAAVLSGAVTPADVRREWHAQVERCLDHRLQPRFLNSHEHIHMLPSLFPVACELAANFGIAHLRFTTARLSIMAPPAALLRNVVMKGLEWVNRRECPPPAPRFLGLVGSGRLTLEDLEREARVMQPGAIYELMCHPGRFDAQEVGEHPSLSYHDWEGEFAAMTSPSARAMLARRGVRLIGYRHLEMRDGKVAVLPEVPGGD
jgi:chitin disaccharide deacetylase